MAWLRRRKENTVPGRLPAAANKTVDDHAVGNRAATGGPRFWLDHGFKDGDRVECAVCSNPLVVKLVEYSPITLSVKAGQYRIPLICGDCGRLFCEDCSLRRNPNRPSCDRCQQVGGVTYLMK